MRLGYETISQAEIGGHSVSMEYQSYSENVLIKNWRFLYGSPKNFGILKILRIIENASMFDERLYLVTNPYKLHSITILLNHK